MAKYRLTTHRLADFDAEGSELSPPTRSSHPVEIAVSDGMSAPTAVILWDTEPAKEQVEQAADRVSAAVSDVQSGESSTGSSDKE